MVSSGVERCRAVSSGVEGCRAVSRCRVWHLDTDEHGVSLDGVEGCRGVSRGVELVELACGVSRRRVGVEVWCRGVEARAQENSRLQSCWPGVRCMCHSPLHISRVAHRVVREARRLTRPQTQSATHTGHSPPTPDSSDLARRGPPPRAAGPRLETVTDQNSVEVSRQTTLQGRTLSLIFAMHHCTHNSPASPATNRPHISPLVCRAGPVPPMHRSPSHTITHMGAAPAACRSGSQNPLPPPRGATRNSCRSGGGCRGGRRRGGGGGATEARAAAASCSPSRRG